MTSPATTLPTAGAAPRVALVTGASSGLGRATALVLARDGYALALAGRNAERLKAVQAACGASASHIIQAELTEEAAPALVIGQVMERFGRLDVLINAAGIIGSGPARAESDAAFDRMMDINLRSLWRLTRAALPALEATRGAIVNISSVAGLRPYVGIMSYCVSKAAVDQLTRCLALELGPLGIRVNAVNPGVVVTELHRNGGMDAAAYAAFLERGRDTHPLGRVGQPEEVAALIAFLASDRAAWITGATVSIDGGRALTSLR